MVETSWAPYSEKMKELLGAMPLVRLTQCNGKELAAAEKTAVPGGSAAVQAFTADKIEKIVLGKIMIDGCRQIGLCAIFPAEGYELPIFFSRWDEGERSIIIYVDLIPTVDSLLDEPYRKKFSEPLGQLWEKFASLPGITPEEYDPLRACSSIVYTAAVVPVEREGMRLAALAPHTEYLKFYIEQYASAEAAADSAKRREMKRRTACVRKTLRNYFAWALAGPAGRNTASALVEKLPDIFF